MWLYTTLGFYSVVHKDGNTQIRARSRAHLQRLIETYPGLLPPETTVIIETPYNDYACRLLVDPATATEIIRRLAQGIDYPDFKGEIKKRYSNDTLFQRLLLQTWGIANSYQRHFWSPKRLSKRSATMSMFPPDTDPNDIPDGPIVEDAQSIGGVDTETGGTRIVGKTPTGKAPKNVRPTDPRETTCPDKKKTA